MLGSIRVDPDPGHGTVWTAVITLDVQTSKLKLPLGHDSNRCTIWPRRPGSGDSLALPEIIVMALHALLESDLESWTASQSLSPALPTIAQSFQASVSPA